MTKQEQIAETAILGCVRNPKAHTAEECAKCDFKHGMCNAYRHVEALYNAVYGKLPEDSVILSREEFSKALTDNFNMGKKEAQFYSERVVIPITRKETAEKFLQLAYDRCLEKSFIKKVEELAKQFGVEIKK